MRNKKLKWIKKEKAKPVVMNEYELNKKLYKALFLKR